MKNFEYYAPTRVIFGKETEKQVGTLIRSFECKKALVLFGGNSAERSGLLERIYSSLSESGISFISLGGVVPNPVLSKVYEGINLCKNEQIDFILAVGGGSVIDTAKAIAYGVANEGDVWDFYNGKRKPAACLPVGAVLTIAASGSEMSYCSMITNESGNLKRACNSDLGRCKFVVMNPELTFTLPKWQTACGCTDILMHSMERYFSSESSMEVTDGISESIMRTVIHNSKILMKEPENYKARAEIMWASSLSHNDLTGCGSASDWATHQLEHELSGMFNVSHGAGLAAIWGSWARYVLKANPNRFMEFASHVLNIPCNFSEPEKAALEGIEALEEFFIDLGMPTKMGDLDIILTELQIEELAQKCSFENQRTIGNFKVLNKEDMKEIYRMASSQ
ncbi:MAG TPA: NADH-dependent alcohol dehydrogenase [Lachnospiraceae bacterium]|nr:NADH-dependent alcohol dehydrogenase [Lachnospiraceae bacterium]